MTEFKTMTIHEKLMTCGERKLIILANNHQLDVGSGATKRDLVPLLEKIVDDDDFPIKCNYDNLDDRIATMSNAEKKYTIMNAGYTYTNDYKIDDKTLRSFITLEDFPIVFKSWQARWQEADPAGKLKLISIERLDKLMSRHKLSADTRQDKIELLSSVVDEYDF